jgi:hypothetical protein
MLEHQNDLTLLNFQSNTFLMEVLLEITCMAMVTDTPGRRLAATPQQINI